MTPPAPSIFISYRSQDRPYAERLCERLERRFGSENVFFDRERDCIPPANNFPQILDAAVDSAEIVLGIVGPGWVAPENLARLNDADDFVRRELVRAMRRIASCTSLDVLPVLVGGVSMPNSLPPDLAGFAQQQAQALRDAPDYESDFEHLIGLIDTRCPGLRARTLNRRLRDLLQSKDISNASLGQDIAVRVHNRHYVPRRHAQAALDAWWRAWPDSRQAFVLLGEEGDGKSWAAADWLARRVDDHAFPVPVVVAPAHKLTHTTPQGILAEVLGEFRAAETERWLKTLDALVDDPGLKPPLFLLVVDALNERPSHRWHELFDALRAPPWRGRVAMLCLCRNAYWRWLAVPQDELTATWKLEPYDAAELDDALAQRQAVRGSFPDELLRWMSHPRYFDLAFRLRNELASGTLAEGELTLERLIYEDWRDMLARKRNRPCSHDDLCSLIVGLAEKHEQRRFASADFSMLAGTITHDVAELRLQLQSAGIVDESNGRMSIGEKPLALALGLVLANAVEDACGGAPAVLAEVIASHIERCPNADLQVRICAMATFHALNAQGYPEAGRLELLRAWVGGRNLDEDDLTKFAAYLPMQPGTYLRMAEIVWGEIDNREVQDAFMAGLLRHRQRPEVDRALRRALTRWLGFIYPWGYRAYYEQDETKLAESRRQVESRLGREATPGPIALLGRNLEIVDNGGILRLAQVALAVISHDRAAGYAPALLNAAIAVAVMDGAHGEYSWVTRTCCPETAAALQDETRRLVDLGRQGNALAWLTARRLLAWLGDEESWRGLDEIPSEFRFVHPLHSLGEENPCGSRMWRWTEANYLDCLEQDFPGTFIATQLRDIALDPACNLPDIHRQRLRVAGEGIDLSQVAKWMGQTAEQHFLEEIEPALCAFAPQRYRQLICALADQLATRVDLSRRMLAGFLSEHFPLLDLDQPATVAQAWRAMLQGANKEDRIAQMYLFPMMAFDQPDLTQFERLLERGDGSGFFCNFAPQFRHLAQGDLPYIATALEAMNDMSRHRLYNLLWYLSEAVNHLDSPLREALLSRFEQFDTVGRAYTLKTFVACADRTAVERIVAAGWHCRAGKEYGLENAWGCILLAELGVDLPFDDLCSRISPEWLGYAVRKRGYRPDELALYARAVDTVWRRLARREDSQEVAALALYAQLRIDDKNVRDPDRLGVVDHSSSSERFANFTWGGSAGMGSVDNLLRNTDPDEQIAKANTLIRQIADLEESERAQGNPWFGFSFRNGELDRLIAANAVPWHEWLAPIWRGDADARRLLGFCRGFYESLCAALMTHAPADGARLYRVLVSRPTIRLTNARLGLPTLLLDVFAAPDAPETKIIRREVVDAATNDLDLFEFALLCRHGGQQEWMAQIIDAWLASHDAYDQARGLALFGFSCQTADGDRLDAWIARRQDCWLRDVALAAQQRQRRHGWACHWFKRFLNREDRCEAWAAFRLFLRCVDRRFWFDAAQYDIDHAALWKRDALAMSIGAIETACKENEKTWKDKLLEQTIKPKELWPWMANYR